MSRWSFDAQVTAADFDAGGAVFALGDGSVRFASGERQDGHDGAVLSAAVHPSGDGLVTGGDDGRIALRGNAVRVLGSLDAGATYTPPPSSAPAGQAGTQAWTGQRALIDINAARSFVLGDDSAADPQQRIGGTLRATGGVSVKAGSDASGAAADHRHRVNGRDGRTQRVAGAESIAGGGGQQGADGAVTLDSIDGKGFSRHCGSRCSGPR